MKFRKKPVVIEAVPVEMVLALHGESADVFAPWVQAAIEKQVIRVYEEVIICKTLEGNMSGHATDWLIKGVQGELYPCRGDIFWETYEQVYDE